VTAAYLGADTTTKGQWQGRYGASGVVSPYEGARVPASIGFDAGATATWLWHPSTTDPRAPQSFSGSTNIASTWYSATDFTLNIAVKDGAPRRVAVYGLDWDNLGRSETIEIVDTASGVVLDRQDVSAFGGGQYWVWRVTGNVTIRCRRTGGANAVISGVFLDF